MSKPLYVGWSIWRIWEGVYLLRHGLGGHPLTPTLEERLERKTHAKQTEIESSSIPYTPLTVLYVLAPVLLIPIRPLYIVMDYELIAQSKVQKQRKSDQNK